MKQYFASRRVKIGIALLVFGSGPLLFILIAAAVGLWPDPNPNPIGPGMLAFLTFWPGVLSLITGIQKVRETRASRDSGR